MTLESSVVTPSKHGRHHPDYNKKGSDPAIMRHVPCLFYYLALAGLMAFFLISQLYSSQAMTKVQASSSHLPDRIRQISILGERNSGTRWTFKCVFVD
jgi:hypothetical protein